MTHHLYSVVLPRPDKLTVLVELRVLRILELANVQGYFHEHEGKQRISLC
jgi:hypothetical protein